MRGLIRRTGRWRGKARSDSSAVKEHKRLRFLHGFPAADGSKVVPSPETEPATEPKMPLPLRVLRFVGDKLLLLLVVFIAVVAFGPLLAVLGLAIAQLLE